MQKSEKGAGTCKMTLVNIGLIELFSIKSTEYVKNRDEE